MAYTNAEKADRYTPISEKLTDAAVLLQDYVEGSGEADSETMSEEVRFARNTAKNLTELVGNLTVKIARNKADETPTE